MLGIGIDTSIASANEVETAIAQQDAKPAAKKSIGKQIQDTADELRENIMDKAVAYIKSQTNKQKAFDAIIEKYGDALTAKQKTGLQKFVR
jgi:radical SAM superfamily enzyme